MQTRQQPPAWWPAFARRSCRTDLVSLELWQLEPRVFWSATPISVVAAEVTDGDGQNAVPYPLTDIPDQVLRGDESSRLLNLSLFFDDDDLADGDRLRYRATSRMPDLVSVGVSGGYVWLSVDEGVLGHATVEITAIDLAGATASSCFNVELLGREPVVIDSTRGDQDAIGSAGDVPEEVDQQPDRPTPADNRPQDPASAVTQGGDGTAENPTETANGNGSTNEPEVRSLDGPARLAVARQTPDDRILGLLPADDGTLTPLTHSNTGRADSMREIVRRSVQRAGAIAGQLLETPEFLPEYRDSSQASSPDDESATGTAQMPYQQPGRDRRDDAASERKWSIPPMATETEVLAPLKGIPFNASDAPSSGRVPLTTRRRSDIGFPAYQHALDRWRGTLVDLGGAAWLSSGLLTASSFVTVGYVAWSSRAGTATIGSMLSVPAWRFLDPETVLRSTSNEEVETLETLVAGDNAGIPRPEIAS